jgi:uncharacterized protein YprB with RNaseH-like and TPR domain
MESGAMEAYLDIETTGLAPASSEITVIGIYLTNGNRNRFIQLVGDRITKQSILEPMEKAKVIYTYNGSRFDLPFIHRRVGIDLTSIFDHCDLMLECWKNSLYGGLKSVERQLNIPRNLRDVDGLEAIRLWWRYINDYDEKALDTLLKYNKEDVINLKHLKERLF